MRERTPLAVAGERGEPLPRAGQQRAPRGGRGRRQHRCSRADPDSVGTGEAEEDEEQGGSAKEEGEGQGCGPARARGPRDGVVQRGRRHRALLAWLSAFGFLAFGFWLLDSVGRLCAWGRRSCVVVWVLSWACESSQKGFLSACVCVYVCVCVCMYPCVHVGSEGYKDMFRELYCATRTPPTSYLTLRILIEALALWRHLEKTSALSMKLAAVDERTSW